MGGPWANMLHTYRLHRLLCDRGALRGKCGALISSDILARCHRCVFAPFRGDVRALSSGSDVRHDEVRLGSAPSSGAVTVGNSTGELAERGSSDLAESAAAEEYCREILADPLSDVSVEETNRFLIPYPKSDRTYLVELLTRPFRENYVYEPASMMLHLCVERLENDELTATFDIGAGFNRRAYFLVLHVWILHRRAMKEIPLGILLDRYLFSFTFDLFKEWLCQRKVPEHRFKRELENCQSFMMKFLVELDQCTLDEELYPYKISRAVKHHMYEDDVSEDTLRLLVKYVLRQFVHISNLETKHYLDAMFLWADADAICKPKRLLKRAMPQLIKYGGYRAPSADGNAPKLGPGATQIDA